MSQTNRQTNSNKKQSTDDDSKVELGPSGFVPMIKHGRGRNNFVPMSRAMYDCLLREFGPIASIVSPAEAYPVYPPIEIDEDRLANDEHGIYASEIKELQKQRLHDLHDLEIKKYNVQGFIFSHLSPESLQQLGMDDEWEEILHSGDPLRLWQLIVDTHYRNSTGIDLFDQEDAEENWWTIRQEPNETLYHYRARFNNTLETVYGTGGEILEDERIAGHFIRTLNVKYNGLRDKVRTQIAFGGERIPTLNKAYSMALLFQPTEPSSDNSTGKVAYHTNSKSNGNNGNYDNNGNGRNNKKKSANKNNNNNNKKKFQKKEDGNEGPVKGPAFYCYCCGDPGHKVKFCPQRKTSPSPTNSSATLHTSFRQNGRRINMAVSKSEPIANVIPFSGTPSGRIFMATATVSAILMAVIDGVSVKHPILLDNQATINVFKDESLFANGLRRADETITFCGVGNEELVTDLYGEIPVFGTVWYHNGAAANILGFGQVEHDHEVKYDRNIGFTVDFNGVEVCFKRVNTDDGSNHALYICNADDYVFSKPVVNVATVAKNEAKYSKREVENAKKAYNYIQELGYPTLETAKFMVSSINNSPVTINDLKRAYDIYGKELGNIKGKMVQRKAQHVNLESEIEIDGIVVKDIIMHSDVMFIARVPFLISVAEPLFLVLSTHLVKSRDTKTIQATFVDQCKLLKRNGYHVKTVRSDGEGGVIANFLELADMGITLDQAGPQQHVPLVERKIKEIKERARSIVSMLPFNLPLAFVKYLVSFVVNRINMEPTKSRGDNFSPKEIFDKRKMDYKIDVRVAFGSYCAVKKPNAISNDVSVPRAEDAIALCPAGNRQGTYLFYSLASGEVVKRDRWVVLPMPETVIKKLNKMKSIFDGKNRDEVHRLFDDDNGIANAYAEARGDELREENAIPAAIHENPFQVLDDENFPDRRGDLVREIADVGDLADGQGADIYPPDELNGYLHQEEDDIPQVGNIDVPIVDDDFRPRYNLRDNPKKKRDSNYVYNVTTRDKPSKTDSSHPKAKEAAIAELKQLFERDVMKVVHPSEVDQIMLDKVEVIPTFMIYKQKFLPDGTLDKYKARLVASGNRQDKNPYNDVSSPTMSLTSLFMITAIAVKENRVTANGDVVGAFLIPELKKKVYGRLPKSIVPLLNEEFPDLSEYVLPNGTMIVLLQHALYGLVESALLFYESVRDFLLEIGFTQNSQDCCVFNAYDGDGCQITVGVYVDDLLVTSAKQELIELLFAKLNERFGEVKFEISKKLNYLGMEFDFGVPGEVKIKMSGYVKDVLDEANVQGSVTSPATGELFVIDDKAALLDKKSRESFHTFVAKLLYLAKRTRPDILTAISFLTTRVSAPTTDDMDKLTRVLKYLNGTVDLGIRLCPKTLNIEAYADASYGVHSDYKSHSGLCIALGDGPVFTKSSKQKLVSKSSTEAELISLSDGASEVIWCNEFLQAQGYATQPPVIYQDNIPTMAMIKRGKASNGKGKHINIRYYFIKDRMESGDITLEHKGTDDMLADFFTKPLQGAKFRELRDKIMNWSY